MEEIQGTSKEKHKKLFTGLGFLPFFQDYSVYRSLRLFAGQEKQRVQSLVIKITADTYRDIMKQELNTNDPSEFHKQIEEASKRKGTKGVADFIEYSCSKYVEKMVEQYKPQIKRG